MGYFVKTIRRNQRLATVFWRDWVLPTVALLILAKFFGEAAYSWPVGVMYVLAALEIIYIIWAHVSLWACAFNIQQALWGYLVRVYVILVAVVWLWVVISPSQHKAVVEKVGIYAQLGVQADVFASPLLRFCSDFIERQKRGLT